MKNLSKKSSLKNKFRDTVEVTTIDTNQPISNQQTSQQEDDFKIDLQTLKSQFEVQPNHKTSKNNISTPNNTPRHSTSVDHQVDREVIKSSDTCEDEVWDVEISSLRKIFDKSPPKSTPKSFSKSKSRTISTSSTTSSSSSFIQTQKVTAPPGGEIVKSSEPVYDEMIGEKSLQDRLARYKQVANVKDKKTSKSRHSNKYKNNFVPEKPVVILENSFTPPTTPTTSEVIRPPPAGAKETINYSLSIDLKETKALFESPERKSRKSFRKKRSTSSSRSLSPKSSRSSSCHSYTLKSQDDSDVINTEMAEIVRPPPAGTKEVVDIQPSLSISAVKSLFEKNKSGSNVVDSEAPKRRQLRSDWASEDGKKEVVVAEGSFVEDNVLQNKTYIQDTDEEDLSVVRPPTAGTKEKPNYQLESNALKSRAAIFQVGKVNEYQPRNRVQKEEKKPAAEIVNRKDVDEQEEDFVPSIDQKAARNVFENHQETSSAPRTVNDVVPAANLSAAKGVFSGEVVAENNKKQDQKEEIPEVEAPKEAPVDLPVEDPKEAPVDLPVEISEEAPVDLPVEAPEEARVDLPTEAPEEAPVDLPVEAPEETRVEAPTEIPFEIPVSFETAEVEEKDTAAAAAEDLVIETVNDNQEEVEAFKDQDKSTE